tara:strand:- start:137 stop:436 length:300 start_codon:yes stop_codon:yes gene_type:complete
MSIEHFTIYWVDATGHRHKELTTMPDDKRTTDETDVLETTENHTVEQTKSAMQRLTKGPAAVAGMIKEVQVVDQDDFTCFLWKEGKVVFPTQEMLTLGG